MSHERLLDFTDVVVRDSSPRLQHAPPPTFLGSRHVVRVTDFHTKLLAIRHGVGFGWMPEHLVREALERRVSTKLSDPALIPRRMRSYASSARAAWTTRVRLVPRAPRFERRVHFEPPRSPNSAPLRLVLSEGARSPARPSSRTARSRVDANGTR